MSVLSGDEQGLLWHALVSYRMGLNSEVEKNTCNSLYDKIIKLMG
jgi:hypothetical protein